MISDDFIADLRAAFGVFGVHEPVIRLDPHRVLAGELVIDHDADAYAIEDMRAHPVARVDGTLHRVAVLVACEWHARHPRQGDLFASVSSPP